VLALGPIAAGSPAQAQVVDPGDDGPALTVTDGLTQGQIVQDLQDALQHGHDAFLQELAFYRSLGLIVFTTPFNEKDGLGDGPFIQGEGSPLDPGSRPTLQGNGQFLRVNGLDSQSCNECHNLISHATRPPHLGIGGVGGVVTNAIIMPSVIDVADTTDNRVTYVAGHDPDLPLATDGVADFNGRFANAPFLFGGGGVELVAKEMTKDLEAILQNLIDQQPPGVTVSLDTKGVHFGTATKLTDGTIKLDLQGLGLIDLDPVHPLTDAQQLVVRPFGRKGDHFSMRDFDIGAMEFHFGMQPVEAFNPALTPDPDQDGVPNEVTVAEMTVLDLFNVTNPPPVGASDTDTHGRELFTQVGCANCHTPSFTTDSPYLTLSYPEIAEDPDAHVYTSIDLRDFGFAQDPNGPGVLVPLYSDLKRHDMGAGLAEDMETDRAKVPNKEFITARLWGISDTGPYLHDGRATSIYQAIVRHSGEAKYSEVAFGLLSDADKVDLINFLKSLHTPPHPNEDITP
jgi:mono/diheme cytochrome c family protein